MVQAVFQSCLWYVISVQRSVLCYTSWACDWRHLVQPLHLHQNGLKIWQPEKEESMYFVYTKVGIKQDGPWMAVAQREIEILDCDAARLFPHRLVVHCNENSAVGPTVLLLQEYYRYLMQYSR